MSQSGAKACGDLTARQKSFVEQYLIDLNATAAYMRAGYTVKNYNAAGASASALLKNPKIRTAIDLALAERSRRTEITQDWVLERLKVESEREGEGASHSARVSAIKLLGQHLGMFADREKPPIEVVLELIRTSLGEDASRRIGEHLRGRGDAGGG